MRHDLEGVYNGAADGVLVLSEVAGLLGKPLAPVLPPVGTVAGGERPAPRRVRISPETLGLLRYGRGLDNRKLKATGYRYRYTSREAVIKLREHQRLAAILGDAQEAYRYERDLEEFLRRSPSVRPTARRPAPAPSNLAPGQRRGRRPRPGLRRLRRPRRRGAHRPAALAGARGAGRAGRARARRTPPGPEVMKAIAGLQGWEART